MPRRKVVDPQQRRRRRVIVCLSSLSQEDHVAVLARSEYGSIIVISRHHLSPLARLDSACLPARQGLKSVV